MNFKTKLNNALIVIAIPLAAVSMNAQADIVHQDDVIIDGSACIGFDCVNGESFGADTLRLKENNLRIKFQDTSSTGSFPTADWEITANDQNNGGANYLAFTDVDRGTLPFRVDQGAGNDALRVDAQGQVGLGTATPVVELHMVDGNTPTLRLEQDGTSGFTPQTWDVAGNEANFFIRDATNGSTLPFRIQPGASTNLLFLDSADQVGIGTNDPSALLHVRAMNASTVAERTVLKLENNGNPALVLKNTNTLVNRSWTISAGLNLVFKNDKGQVIGKLSEDGDFIFLKANGREVSLQALVTLVEAIHNTSL